MGKKQKTFRPKARLPRGFKDRLGAELVAEREMLSRISAVYERWGFDPLETPAFEYTDALGKFLPDVDRPNAGVFSVQDDDDQWMSLRYDLTAPLARFVAENYDGLPKPFRRYQAGPVWRNEKPGPGRFRQFTQCDADTVGAPGAEADAEICALFADVIEAAGIDRGDYLVRVSDRRVLDGVLEVNGVSAADQKLAVLRSLDKLDRLGADGVRALLGEGRKDESGDYTEGAKLNEDQIASVLSIFQLPGADGDSRPSEADWLDAWRKAIKGSEVGEQGLASLETLFATLRAMGFADDRICLDGAVVRGLEYYTGSVFEADLLLETIDEKGRPVQIGSVGGGGRYDGLVARFKGTAIPAVGVSIGVSRLIAAQSLKKTGDAVDAMGPVVVLALEPGRMGEYQKMAAELRAAGMRAEVYLGGSSMRAQMKYADKRAAPVAVIEGEDERVKGEITIKDLVRGAALSQEIEDNKEWREAQPAQFAVKRDALVDAVKTTLARHQSGE
ncbi:MAG: histidine--tRNA ligase [Pseudomonadota bacterium]